MEIQTTVETPLIFLIIFLLKKFGKFLAVRLRGLFWAGNKVGCSFFLSTLDLTFGGFTLCPVEGSNSYILKAILSPFLWTLNKVWPFNPTASRLGRPECEVALSHHIYGLSISIRSINLWEWVDSLNTSLCCFFRYKIGSCQWFLLYLDFVFIW
jgi:hypothetical protein